MDRNRYWITEPINWLTESIKVRCKIYRGVWLSKRYVEVAVGNVIYDGAIPLHYLQTKDGDPIPEAIPSLGCPYDGVCFAQLMKIEGGSQWIRFPDGKTMIVSDDELSAILGLEVQK